jgi:peptide-methionine (S)-S-oxide reductase
MTGNRLGLEQATLGGGCFWCLEAVFEQVQGVQQVVSGYSAGQTPDPNYEQICTGQTGHAEVVQITFDPQVVSYQTLLEIFFTIHDPTTLNRQGNDRGTQYRSIILYHDANQKAIAQAVLQKIGNSGIWGAPLVTQLQALERFYPAEDYHQGYYRGHPNQGYCMLVVAPKVVKFREKYRSLLKNTEPKS